MREASTSSTVIGPRLPMMESGLSVAWWRMVTATSASSSLVAPNSCMYRRAHSAYHVLKVAPCITLSHSPMRGAFVGTGEPLGPMRWPAQPQMYTTTSHMPRRDGRRRLRQAARPAADVHEPDRLLIELLGPEVVASTSPRRAGTW